MLGRPARAPPETEQASGLAISTAVCDSKLEAALAWASRGFRIFPLQVNSKFPTDIAWTNHATTDPQIIKALWTDSVTGFEHDYNIGFLTTGWIVIDVDVKNGKPGLKTFFDLGLDFDTLCVRTPSGGYHLIYQGIDRIVGAGHIVSPDDGLDIRSYHGYTAAAGSAIDGVPYVVELDFPVAPFPEHLRDRLKSPRQRSESLPPDVELDTPELVELVAHWLRHDALPAVEGAGGDARTYQTACQIRDYGISEPMAFELFIDEYNQRCSPPWEPDAARVKIENAYRYATGEIGGKSPAAAFGHVVLVDPPAASLNAELMISGSLLAISAASLADLPVPERPWLVSELIPDRSVTLLSGDGGVGKSLLTLQLGLATATGTPWLGHGLVRGPALYVGAEDDLDELHRRLVDLTKAQCLDLADAKDLHILSLAGQDAVLAVSDGRSGKITQTQLWERLEAEIARLSPRLLVLDNLADVFAGNENSRPEARQFVGMLRGLAIRHKLAVVLLGHPSLTGISSGTGTSGSTAWNNSVRARLYLDRPKVEADEEPNETSRVLRSMKSNYGPMGMETRLRWERGHFRLDEPSTSAAGADDRGAFEAHAEQVFLRLLARLHDEGRDVSAKIGPTYAPAVFSKHGNRDGLAKKVFERAMERLFASGSIKAEVHGPRSRQRSRLVRVSP